MAQYPNSAKLKTKAPVRLPKSQNPMHASLPSIYCTQATFIKRKTHHPQHTNNRETKNHIKKKKTDSSRKAMTTITSINIHSSANNYGKGAFPDEKK